MIDLLSQPVVVIVLITSVGIVAQWVAWKTRLPSILYLLLAGIVLGPVGGVVKPDELFGDLLFPFISLSVAIILFEGSLTLRFSELTDIGRVVRNLVSIGALINATITAAAAHWFVGLSWQLSALFGALMVVLPMLRTVKPKVNLARVLRWEGIIIDPLGAIFALLIFEFITAQQGGNPAGHVLLVFLKSIAVGSLCGAATGQIYGMLLRRQWLPEYLHNFAAVAAVAATYTLADVLAHESGLLAVTIMGIWLANMRDVYMRSILEFKESLTVIFVSVLFIILAARLDLRNLYALGWSAIAVLLTMQFISRPAKVLISTLGSLFNLRERLLLAWIGPRGIVAAAVTAVFAIRLQQTGTPGADYLVPLAFAVIIGTVVIQGATARPLARLLGVTNPDLDGCLIIGANAVARTIGGALKQAGVQIVLCDNYWDNIRLAKERELPVYYGNPMSEHAMLHIDLTALGTMLGLSHDDERNLAAALRYRQEFGYHNLFILPSRDDRREHDKHRVSRFYSGRVLFNESNGYGKLASLISQGAVVKKTRLTENFTYENWQEHYRNRPTIELFAVDPANHIHWYTVEKQPEPSDQWTVYALSVPETGKSSKAGPDDSA